jgi:predicted house-cleaning noncanonical NTP pyrophosphatase (MazG superfamily)
MVPLAERYVIGSWEDHLPQVSPEAAEFLGGKAIGLLSIPRNWVPPFVLLTKRFRVSWDKQSNASSVLTQLPLKDRSIVQRFLEIAADAGSRILVRSNSPRELGFSSRGAFRSIPATAVQDDLLTAVDQVFRQSSDLFAVVQLAIEPGLPGHMSNERRVTPRRSLWLIEDSDGRFRQERIEALKSHEPPLSLLATTESELLQVLRQMAAYLQSLGDGYFHCEWIWNRSQTWIVQADSVPLPSSDLPTNRYLRGADLWPLKFRPEWFGLRHFSTVEAGKWRKLRRPRTFAKCGLPTADVYLLSGDDWKNGGGARNAELARDLENFCQHLVVVRCDVNDENYTLLPTSPPSRDPAVLLKFMEQTFESKSVADSDWAFLLANLVPARVSAMVQAFPSAERVRVDALWGFPDGLLHFPHDSYFFSPNDGRFEKTVNFKGLCLLFEDGAWTYSEIGRPEDWESTLSNDEVETLSKWALLLAKELNQQVQLMALARIGGLRGPNACLPWHYTNFVIPSYTESARKLPMTKELRLLTSFEDLNSAFASESTVQAYVLRPNPSLLRDTEFLTAVGQFVAQHNTPLYFEGSLLGHSYYVLSNAGAHVVPIVDEPQAEAKPYYKLVRDEIPTIIQRAGGLARLRTLTKQDARVFLARKLLEEAMEVWAARESDEIGGELADVLEVLDALREQCGIPSDKVNTIREKKRKSRGGFEKLIYLEETRPGTLDATRKPGAGLALFADDQPWEGKSGPTQPLELQAEEFTDDSTVFRFGISLLPPVKAASAINEIAVLTKNYTVSAAYEKDRVILTVARKKHKRPPNQLMLFEDINGSE